MSEGVGSLEQSFETQLQKLTQISRVKSSSKETSVNNESDILTELLQDTIHTLKKEAIDKERIKNNLSIILKISRLIHTIYPLPIKNLAMK